MSEAMAYRPQPLRWQEQERVRDLQLWLDCMARCRECGELMPMQDFDDRLNVCWACLHGHHRDALIYRRRKAHAVSRRRAA